MDGYLALVHEISDNEDPVVSYIDESRTETIEEHIGSVIPGDLVRVVSSGDSRIAVEKIKDRGYDSGNSIGVITKIFEEKGKVAIKTRHNTFTSELYGFDVCVGDTVELTRANTIRCILDEEPIDIDDDSVEVNIDLDNLIESSEDENEIENEYLIEDINIEFDDVGGLQRLKDRIGEEIIVPRKYEKKTESLGINTNRGFLFYGPPGTGKTMMAKALSNELDCHFFSIRGPEIVNKYYGGSERVIREIFKEAADNEPSVIFIDEVDSVAPSRERTDATERRIVAQLLTELDGFEERGDVIVIGATNKLGQIDSALRRPGRLGEQIKFSLPQLEDRFEILKLKTQKRNMNASVNLWNLATQTEDWTGADLESLIERAAFLALNDQRDSISQSDLEIAYDEIREERLQSNEMTRENREEDE